MCNMQQLRERSFPGKDLGWQIAGSINHPKHILGRPGTFEFMNELRYATEFHKPKIPYRPGSEHVYTYIYIVLYDIICVNIDAQEFDLKPTYERKF